MKAVKLPKAPKADNPCLNAPLSKLPYASPWYGMRQGFTPSSYQLKKYGDFYGHKLVMNWDADPPAVTFDTDALRILRGRYPSDPVYKELEAYRELEKCKGTYLDGMPPGPDGRVHGVFCVTGDHEVLTPTGWVRFDSYVDGTPVAQWDAATRAVDFVVPRAVTRTSYEGPLHHLVSRRIDILATPDHKLLYQYRSQKKLWWRKAGMAQLPVQLYIPACGLSAGTDNIDDWLRLALAIQADAHVKLGKKWGGRVMFVLGKSRKIARLRALCARLGIQLRERPHGKWWSYTFPSDACKLSLEWLGPNKTLDTTRLLRLSAAAMHEVLTECGHWDGTGHAKSKWQADFYFSTNQANAETLATLAHLCGRVATLSVRENPGTNWKPCHTVTFAQRAYRAHSEDPQVIVPFKGMVYCVTVPTGYFLLRRNGKIIVSGNSDVASTLRWSMQAPSLQVLPRPEEGEDPSLLSQVRNIFTAAPGYALHARDFGGIEAVLTFYLANARQGLRLAGGNIQNVHGWIASHAIGQPVDLSWSDSDIKDALTTFAKDKRQWKVAGGASMPFKKVRTGAKRSLFLSLYGGTPARMTQAEPDIFPTKAIAEWFQKLFFDLFPEVPRWQWSVCEEAGQKGYITTPDGFRQWFFDPWSYTYSKRLKAAGKDPWVKRYSLQAKEIMAAKPQHLAAMYMALTLDHLWREAPEHIKQGLRLTIHDEILGEWPVAQLAEADKWLMDSMERPCGWLPLPPEWGMGSHLQIRTSAKRGTDGGSWGKMEECA